MLTFNIALACLVSFCVAEDSFIGFQWSDQTLHAVAEDTPTQDGPIIGTTDWGEWKTDIRCTGNNALIGFELEVYNDDWLDKVGVTGIKLLCKKGNDPKIAGGDGHFGNDHLCPKGRYITKIAVQYTDNGGAAWINDDTAINNIRITCNDNSVVYGEGLDQGVWSKDAQCPAGPMSRICGVRPKIDMDQAKLLSDATGMNKLQLICCKKAGGGGDRRHDEIDDDDNWPPRDERKIEDDDTITDCNYTDSSSC